MINPRPGTRAHRLLSLVVREPGCWTAAELAAAVDPPRFDRHRYAEWVTARRAHTRAVSRELGRLVEAGFIEKQRPPRLADWFRNRVVEMGPRQAVVRLRPPLADGLDWLGDADLGDDEALERESDADPNVVILVRRLLDAEHRGKLLRTRDLIRGGSGALRSAYRWLCEEGAIEAPSLRWPTAAGIGLVNSAPVVSERRPEHSGDRSWLKSTSW